MRARTFAYLAPLALALGCSQGTLRTGDAAVDVRVADTGRAEVAIDAGAVTDGPVVIDASTPDAAPVDATLDTTVDATVDTTADATLDTTVDATLDATADAGSDTMPTSTDGPTLTGRHSFVVTSTITTSASSGPAPPADMFTKQVFTMVVDADQGIAIVGANGSATSQPVEVSGSSLRFPGPLNISTGGCYASVRYTNPTFLLGPNGQLTSSSTGFVTWTYTDIGQVANAMMSLTGVNDAQPPMLSVVSPSPDLTDPFTSFSLGASEPLPPDTRATLVGSASGEIVFLPSNAQTFAVSLTPAMFLRYDEQYHLSVDGITDFAGNAAAASTVQFTTRAAPPLAAEDGFESTTGATLGGAEILADTGAPVIAGSRSLYIPTSSGGVPGQKPQRTQFALRLTVAPGDTVVRFTYRAVNPYGSYGWYFAVASPGGRVATMTSTSALTPTTSATIAGKAVTLGPLTMTQIPLPANASSEVVIARIVHETGCTGMPGSTIEGIIIDDLRVE